MNVIANVYVNMTLGHPGDYINIKDYIASYPFNALMIYVWLFACLCFIWMFV